MSAGLWGPIQVLAAAAGRDGEPSLDFSQPQQAEALQGGFDEEVFGELGALALAVLQSLSGKGHGQGGVVWRPVAGGGATGMGCFPAFSCKIKPLFLP